MFDVKAYAKKYNEKYRKRHWLYFKYYGKRWREANPNYMKKYYRDNREALEEKRLERLTK